MLSRLQTIPTATHDAEIHVIKVTYPGTGNYSQFAYDGFGKNAVIQEYTSSSLTSTKQFVWVGNRRRESRDASSTITAQYFPYGETISGTSYYWVKDTPGSVREMYSSGVQAQYNYDPFGRVTKISETVPSDFGFAGYYVHSRSGLNLTRTRAFSASLGRWLSRDPVAEKDGNNLYAYVSNRPISFSDPLGLSIGSPAQPPVASPPSDPPPPPPPQAPVAAPPDSKKKCDDKKPPPPVNPDKGKPDDCDEGGNPPKPGTDPTVTTWIQCCQWCVDHCSDTPDPNKPLDKVYSPHYNNCVEKCLSGPENGYYPKD
jgi:RHS repeat-associated protein